MIGKLNTVRLSLEAIADHVKTTGYNIKWDHFEWYFGDGQNRLPLQNQRNLFIQELEPDFNVNIESEKLMLY